MGQKILGTLRFYYPAAARYYVLALILWGLICLGLILVSKWIFAVYILGSIIIYMLGEKWRTYFETMWAEIDYIDLLEGNQNNEDLS